ncbi:hypothetical protein GCM10023175_45600 [Pseudonocardia xishanensis]|uniref:Uncharacterized protein n=1 Tax=Pseudonocardia xishanensis TaxID=630995 RepID=A0ABP8RWD9_9PSEU
MPAEYLRRALAQHAVRQRGEVGLELPESSAGVATGGQRADLHVGMGQEEPQQLSPGIATRSCDRDPYHADDYAESWKLMQRDSRFTLAP